MVTDKSADVFTAVVAVAELFAELGSVVVVVAVAVFVIVLPAAAAGSTWTTGAIVAEPPAGIVPRVHVTVVVPAQVPCDGVAETKLVPVGTTSVNDTPSALDGPALVTVIA